MRTLFTSLAFTALMLAPFAAKAQSAEEITITLKDHKFVPAEVKAPANKRLTITVINEDPTPEEFESKSMKFEKVIGGKQKGVVRVSPLKPGKYEFFGEYHEDTAKGTLIAE